MPLSRCFVGLSAGAFRRVPINLFSVLNSFGRAEYHSARPFVLKIIYRKWNRPLIFRNFLSKIFRKPKTGYAPHQSVSQTASPQGEAFTKAIFQTKKKSRLFFISLLCGKSAAPHHLASQGASPRGEAAKRLTIFSGQGGSREAAEPVIRAKTIEQGTPLISQLRWQLPPEGKPFLLIYIFVLHHIIIDICQNIE